ncbi:hypothetical protein P7D79_02765 [Enterococcus avium]|uniref:Uncharacterized protein n=1 Tax=Enterococcus avium TaxID=33945 RepID=A0ABD5F4H4_ENTAV|nr:hypothetical protein [Enterococcus avium]MDT2513149.1 hypothetical protein [Enterococcus avium]
MRFLEIISKLGETASNEDEKELLRSYYERLRKMVRIGGNEGFQA